MTENFFNGSISYSDKQHRYYSMGTKYEIENILIAVCIYQSTGQQHAVKHTIIFVYDSRQSFLSSFRIRFYQI